MPFSLHFHSIFYRSFSFHFHSILFYSIFTFHSHYIFTLFPPIDFHSSPFTLKLLLYHIFFITFTEVTLTFYRELLCYLFLYRKCATHVNAMAAWAQYKLNIKQNSTIDQRMKSYQAQVIENNLHYLKTLVRVGLLCAQQEIGLL